MLATFFNDLFVYLIDKDEWRKVTSPNSPLPRSGHAWCRSDHGTNIYLFGGEFSSPKQGTFYHYNDFWKLEPSTREWTRIETKGKGPPARSGHRMTHFKVRCLLGCCMIEIRIEIFRLELYHSFWRVSRHLTDHQIPTGPLDI